MEQGEYSDDLVSDLNDLLAVAKGSDVNRLSTRKLVDKLVSMGYSVGSESLLLLLNDNPFVASADESLVTLNGGEADVGNDSIDAADPDQDAVSTMAQMSVKKDM